jgi:glycosyltransferase involved in cell wall biosynthesis
MGAWSGLTVHTIGVSQWTDECVRASRLFQTISGERRVIHNGVDENVFCPGRPSGRDPAVKREGCRWRIAFGAVSQGNAIKGGDLLKLALLHLKNAGYALEVITFGRGEITGLENVVVDNRGRIESAEELAALYNSADVMVVPSRLETFGQTACEALACGTPVVCFDTSGLRDVVEHERNGYRAKCYDPGDLARGIVWCLEDPKRHEVLRQRARDTVLERFRINDVAAKTMAVYEEILSNR